ncbi:MerR family transcriptional regulator [Pantoea osteomyelitidis]|uniref:MerR family transcriptional regulator n=1 Tax=Pantoea osteomyelitidis TaxID=3230026 RepID=A0ABW7Q0C9_9GAMM
MPFLTIDSVCALTGVQPATLYHWRHAGLISRPASKQGYSDSQFDLICMVLALSNTGATPAEMLGALQNQQPLSVAGWSARKGDLLYQLEYGNDDELYKTLRQSAAHYSGDDLVNALLRPLNNWLRNDHRAGAAKRLARFHYAVVRHACRALHLSRKQDVNIYLEAVSVRDDTEIWLEAIRLTGQGFHVELSLQVGTPVPFRQQPMHYLMWCGAGISPEMKAGFFERLEGGDPVLLCGPDTRVWQDQRIAQRG